MAKKKIRQLSAGLQQELMNILQARFEKNKKRHKDLGWMNIQKKLESAPDKLFILNEMERTGGEPDVIGYDKKSNEYIFCDCAIETPKERRSLCYDRDGLESRKEFKPANSAMDMAEEIGIEMLNEVQYLELQQIEKFDTKTSSWIRTSEEMRKLGGALFADYRFGRVFFYHNTAQSYYGSRGFRGLLKI